MQHSTTRRALLLQSIVLFFFINSCTEQVPKENIWSIQLKTEILNNLPYTTPVSQRTRSIFSDNDLGNICASLYSNRIELYSLDKDSIIKIIPVDFIVNDQFQIQAIGLNMIALASQSKIYRYRDMQWDIIDLKSRLDSIVEIRSFSSLAITSSYDIAFTFAAVSNLSSAGSGYYDGIAVWKNNGDLNVLDYDQPLIYRNHGYLIGNYQITCKNDSIIVSCSMENDIHIFHNANHYKVDIATPYTKFKDLPDATNNPSEDARLAMFVYRYFESYGPIFSINSGRMARILYLRKEVNEPLKNKILIQVISDKGIVSYYSIPTNLYTFEPGWNNIGNELIYLERKNDSNENCQYIIHTISIP